MSKSDIKQNIKEVLIKKYKKIKIESPILNLSESSFKYRKQITSYFNNKLPFLKNQEKQILNSSTKSMQNISKERKSYLLGLKQNYESKNQNKNSLIRNNDNKLKIPKIIIPKLKFNSVNNLSSHGNHYLSNLKKKIKANDNKLYNTKRMEDLFLPNENKKQINEVLGVKKEYSHEIKNENYIFELLLKSLGINKNTEDKIIKKISIGRLNKNYSTKKNKDIINKKLRNIRTNFFNKKNNSVKYLGKNFSRNDAFYNINHHSSLTIKNYNYKKKEDNKRDTEELINHFKKVHFKNINKNLKKLGDEMKYIKNRLNKCFFKAQDNFNNDLKKELQKED